MKRIIHFVIHSRAAAYVAALLMVCLWGYTIATSTDDGGSGWQRSVPYIIPLVYTLSGIVLTWADRQFALSGSRIPLPATFFFMACCLTPQHALCPTGMMHLILIALGIYLLLCTYRHRNSMGSYFMAFALTGIATVITPQIIFMVPLLIVCCHFLHSLHIRTFAASLIGLLFPYWIILSILFLTDNLHLAEGLVQQLTQPATPTAIRMTVDVGSLPPFSFPMVWGTIAWLILLTIPNIVNNSLTATQQLRVRDMRHFLAAVTIILLASIAISPNLYHALAPSTALTSAMVGTSLFSSSRQSNSRNIWLITLLVIWLLIIGLYIWNSFTIY